MKYLIVNSDGDETFYNIADIDKIVCDYAQNLFSDADLRKNDLKPLEMLTVVYFKDGSTATYHTAGLEIGFD